MDPKEYVETRTKRYMAQHLELFEERIEGPIRNGKLPSAEDIDVVKRSARKRLQALGTDCLDIMPSDLSINAFELLRR